MTSNSLAEPTNSVTPLNKGVTAPYNGFLVTRDWLVKATSAIKLEHLMKDALNDQLVIMGRLQSERDRAKKKAVLWRTVALGTIATAAVIVAINK